MMLSVLKNTKSPVKFWFLKNYLSPTFKVKGEMFVIYLVHTELLLSNYILGLKISGNPITQKMGATSVGSSPPFTSLKRWEVKWMSKVIEHPGVEYPETHSNRTCFSINKSTRFGSILSYNPK